MRLFPSPTWIFSALVVVIPAIAICLAALWLMRKWVPSKELKGHHDVAGVTFGIIGVLYSVILGFTVVNVQTRFNDVLKTVHAEAISIADLYREASFFPIPSRDQIRTSLKEYTHYVIEKEWANPNDKKINVDALGIMEKIWNNYYQIKLDSEKIKIWYEESISKLDTFMNARLSRQFSCWEKLGPMMWSILIIGAIVTVSFMYFFGLEKIHVQMMMTSLVVGYVSFMLYLVYSLDNVFKGPEGIKPTAFEQILNLFDHWDYSKEK